MISKKETRKSLERALKNYEERSKIDWPMAKFRHCVFKVADTCKLVTHTTWQFDIFKKTTTCIFHFKNKNISCTYDFEKDTVFINDEYSAWSDTVPSDDMADVVKSRQPKVKIIIKKKES